MVGSNHTGVALWFTIPIVVDQRRKRHARGSSPVVVRDEVIVLIPTRLRLLFDHTEDLVDRRVPLVQVNTVVPGSGPLYVQFSFMNDESFVC